MTTQSSIVLIVHAPELLGDDGRTLAAVQGLERAFPGIRMEWKISEEGKPIALPQRAAWLAEAAARGKFPMLCNGDESYPVTIAGLQRPPRLSPGGQPRFEVYTQLPLDAAGIAAAAGVLEGVAEGASSFWGHATPHDVAAELSQQTIDPVRKPGSPPRGLPALKFPDRIRSPEIPGFLGWLNYWSPATARILGFPDPSRDAELLSRSRQTAKGGWVVRLTEAPLDLDNPVHLEALMRAYERFPEVGGRSTP
ncbi:MAG: hypothetical protein EOO71_24920 [Myxococcaceae bacterium]|nr:MAG: hypothetical protein EOO71_24920 [Myxococcaceae bacterium]